HLYALATATGGRSVTAIRLPGRTNAETLAGHAMNTSVRYGTRIVFSKAEEKVNKFLAHAVGRIFEVAARWDMPFLNRKVSEHEAPISRTASALSYSPRDAQ